MRHWAWDVLPDLAMLSFAIPMLVGLRARRLNLSLRLIVIYSAAALAEGLVMWYLSEQNRPSLWLIHVFGPFEATILLYALSRWQLRELARLTIVFCIPAFLLLWGGLTITTESLEKFPQYVKTVESFLLVAVSAYTLVSRSRSLVEPLAQQDWFWVCVGLMIYFSMLAVLNPVANLLLEQDSMALLMAVFEVNAALIIVHNILFAWAIRCQQQQMNSGGSLSPRPLSA